VSVPAQAQPTLDLTSALPPVDVTALRVAFVASRAPGQPGPKNAVATFLRSVAQGDSSAFFNTTGLHPTTAELDTVRTAVFKTRGMFNVTEIWNNDGVNDGSGDIVRAVAEKPSGELLQTTLRVNEADGHWFVTQWAGTGLPPSFEIRKQIDAEALRISQSGLQDTVCAKPVIYLYPPVTTRVRVRLDVAGTLTASEPAYDRRIGGWDVTARPDGTLAEPGGPHTWPYLFWEAEVELPSGTEGWVMSGAETGPFLRAKLAERGLIAPEIDAFLEYWLPKMRSNPYNFIRFEGRPYEEVAQLTVTPRPDATIRVFMTFTPLDRAVAVVPQKLPIPAPRHGFTVVEWGGREVPLH
jgi:hypothetical protein